MIKKVQHHSRFVLFLLAAAVAAATFTSTARAQRLTPAEIDRRANELLAN